MSAKAPAGEIILDAEPVHEAFTRLPRALRHDASALFAELTYDVSAGIEMCIGLLEGDDLRRQSGDAPVLGQIDAGRAYRLVIASARLLAQQAEAHLDSLIDHAEREAK